MRCTASRVLRIPLAPKCWQWPEKLDYRINLTASMLKSGRSNIIHVIVNEFDSPFYSKLVESLVTETTERGLTPFVEQTRYSPDAAKHALANNPFSGQLFDGEIIHASGLNGRCAAFRDQPRPTAGSD